MQYVPTPHSYSSAVSAGGAIYLGLHRGRGNTFSEQFAGTLDNLKKTLANFGLGLDSLAKVNVWLKDIHDLPVMEKLFQPYFAENHYPARMTATTQFIDADCLLMIDGIAVIPSEEQGEVNR